MWSDRTGIYMAVGLAACALSIGSLEPIEPLPRGQKRLKGSKGSFTPVSGESLHSKPKSESLQRMLRRAKR